MKVQTEPNEPTAWSRINKRKLLERFAIEIGPALVFVLALQAGGIDTATILFVVALGIAASYSWFEKRHFPYIPFGMVVMAAAFGAATIAFDDASYIEFRATLVNAGGAVAIIVGLLTGSLILKKSLQDGFRLTDGAWWVLSLRMALYLLVMAILNEIVWRNFSTEVWGWFKAASPMLNLLFLGLNWPLIRANLSGDQGEQVDRSPPAGPKTAMSPARRSA